MSTETPSSRSVIGEPSEKWVLGRCPGCGRLEAAPKDADRCYRCLEGGDADV